jgi:hypothetical protein
VNAVARKWGSRIPHAIALPSSPTRRASPKSLPNPFTDPQAESNKALPHQALGTPARKTKRYERFIVSIAKGLCLVDFDHTAKHPKHLAEGRSEACNLGFHYKTYLGDWGWSWTWSWSWARHTILPLERQTESCKLKFCCARHLTG